MARLPKGFSVGQQAVREQRTRSAQQTTKHRLRKELETFLTEAKRGEIGKRAAFNFRERIRRNFKLFQLGKRLGANLNARNRETFISSAVDLPYAHADALHQYSEKEKHVLSLGFRYGKAQRRTKDLITKKRRSADETRELKASQTFLALFNKELEITPKWIREQTKTQKKA